MDCVNCGVKKMHYLCGKENLNQLHIILYYNGWNICSCPFLQDALHLLRFFFHHIDESHAEVCGNCSV